MSQPLPLQTLPPDNTFQSPHLNPNPNPTWQEIARAWLSSLPKNHNPTASEIDAWIDSNQAALPEDFISLPRPELHKWFLSLHSPALSPYQVGTSGQVEFPYRFQRTDLWKPVYRWLESLDKDVLVSGKEISEWLSANPLVMERLFSKHSQYHMMHYIQRMHLKLLKKRGKLPKSNMPTLLLLLCSVNAFLGKFSGGVLRDNKTLLSKKKEAFLRYELLTDLQSQLTSVLLRHKHAIDFKESCHSDNNTNLHSSIVGRKDVCAQVMPENTSHSRDVQVQIVSDFGMAYDCIYPANFADTGMVHLKLINPQTHTMRNQEISIFGEEIFIHQLPRDLPPGTFSHVCRGEKKGGDHLRISLKGQLSGSQKEVIHHGFPLGVPIHLAWLFLNLMAG
ncbi:hypothetical protein COCNU_11G003160 [Cocos nucifera]|uniref:Uncharacterized protein n=1 Tax=Cocos nucifera TaxID=13894 RepID=A0A8K0INL3_COCNU|nr:hypothetical protein COCNU_11G003160 [Cocos nucifera]